MGCYGKSVDHCCWADGVECPMLVVDGGRTWCAFMLAGESMLGNPEWEALPVGLAFARDLPGFDCYDWPQNISKVMAGRGSKCCWGDG